MGDNNRRKFLKQAVDLGVSQTKAYDISKDEVFKKYSNKSLPIVGGKKTRSGIATYTGAFTDKEKIHLLRRTMFGVKPSDVLALNGMTPAQAVDYLFSNIPVTAPPPPVNYYQDVDPPNSNDPTIALGATWINAPWENGTIDYYRTQSLKAWWIKNILQQGVNIQDKMMLFWSNYFTIQTASVGDARFLYQYFTLVRTYNVGNFKTFAKEITKNTEMLIYLNGHYNTVGSPDENYARELQELFTIGKGIGLYTEDDVKAAAKVLTGWRVDSNAITSGFMPASHDSTNKQFSAFYNNTIITGQTGAAGANELDDLINMIFSKQQEVAKFFCRKLYRFFVYYDIDAQVETDVITPLAQTFIANNWEVAPVLKQLLKSQHFFDTNSMDCHIKNPLDFLVSTFRTLQINIPATLSIEDYYKCHQSINNYSSYIAMDILDPPNVSGFPAYYQVPQFYEMWINSDTLPKRLRISEALASDYGLFTHGTFTATCNVMAYAQTMTDPSDPNLLIDDFVKYMLGVGLDQSTKDAFKVILTGGTITSPNPDYYWTNNWNGYIANPTIASFIQAVKIPLQNLLRTLMRQEEHQLM